MKADTYVIAFFCGLSAGSAAFNIFRRRTGSIEGNVKNSDSERKDSKSVNAVKVKRPLSSEKWKYLCEISFALIFTLLGFYMNLPDLMLYGGIIALSFIIAATDMAEKNIYIYDVFMLIFLEMIYLYRFNYLGLDNFIYLLVSVAIFASIVKITGAMGEGDAYLIAAAGIVNRSLMDMMYMITFIFVLAAAVSLMLIAVKRRSLKDVIAFAPYIIAVILTELLKVGV